MFLVLQWYFIPRSRHCGLIATQSEIPLLLEHVLLIWWFFATPVLFDVFVFLPVVLVLQWYAGSRSLVGQRWCLTWCLVIFVWLQCYMRSYACWIVTLWHDTHSVWFSFHFWAHLIISSKLCRFSFIWQIVIFVSVFLVSEWCICSKSLVGHRWCLRWCSVIFVWLQCYMRSYACWIATLWHDTYAVWDSSAFRECFISFFGSVSVIVCLACLSLNRSPCSWYYIGTLFRVPWLVSVHVWREDR